MNKQASATGNWVVDGLEEEKAEIVDRSKPVRQVSQPQGAASYYLGASVAGAGSGGTTWPGLSR